MTRIFFLSLLALAFLKPGCAQNFEVVKAEYGADANWTDVTDRVRALVRGNGVEFTVDGQTLGDPLPGQQKTLRVRYVFRNRTRTENFRDLDVVRLGNPGMGFPGGGNTGGGNTGGGFGQGLGIERARYGVGNRWLDVTQLLRDSVRDNTVRLQVNNASFGSDPAPANEKVLEVEYTYRGQRQNITVRENQYLELPGGATSGGANGGGFGNSGANAGLEIVSARYGTMTRNVDVTERVRGALRDGRIDLRVDRSSMGSNPSNSRRNELEVEYLVNGRRQSARVAEGGVLQLNASGGSIFGGGNSDPNALVIESATWGSNNRINDVTQDLRRQMQSNRLNVRADNSTFSGRDPAVGADKELFIRYRVGNGPAREVRVREGRSVSIP